MNNSAQIDVQNTLLLQNNETRIDTEYLVISYISFHFIYYRANFKNYLFISSYVTITFRNKSICEFIKLLIHLLSNFCKVLTD